MRPRLKGFAKRGFSGRCEYYFLFATLPNVFSYTFGWTTTLQKSKIEHQCRVILLEHFLLKIMTIQYQVHFGEFLTYNILNKWDN